MKKTSLLITSFALLVGGGLLCSASPITPNARKTTIEDPSIYTYTKVESASDIVSGSQYIFTCDGTLTSDGVASGVNFMSEHGGKYYNSNTNISEALLLTITQESDSNYSISFDDSGVTTYVSYSDNNENEAYTSTTYNNQSAWTFGEGKEGAIAVNNVGSSTRRLQYNSNNPRFACYTGSQKDLTIYKVEEVTEYTVTFHYGWDGTQNVTTKEASVMDGKTVEVPSDIDTNVENYRFVGWYTSTDYTTEFDFEAGITGNTDIYAYYEATADYTIGDYFAANDTKSSMIASYQMGTAATEITASFKNNSGVKTVFDENSNNAKAILGEDHAEYINVTYVKGGSTVSAVWGDNTGIRFYQKDTLTFTAAEGVLITSIEYNWGYTGGELSINGEVAEKNGTTEINGTSFVLESTGNKQARIYSLIVHYTADLPAYKVADASLRFGANVSMEYYDETAKYGLILGNNLEDTAIKAKLNNEATAEEFATANGLVAIENTSVAFVDGNGSEVEQASATNYQFATVLTGMVTHLSDKVTAAAYMEFDGKLYLMDETTYSLKTLAQKYLDDQLVTDPDGIGLLEAIIAA